MYNIKEMFNEENFDANTLTVLIYSATDVYEDKNNYNNFVLSSLDTLNAEKYRRKK